MIPPAYITEWSALAPWPDPSQIEQDLILSRLIVEIANHEVLGPELAFRGGTCLHKLHLPAPLRYSEDLDYVRQTHSGIKAHVAGLQDVANAVGLREHAVQRSGDRVRVFFEADPTHAVAGTTIRIKIEIDVRETASLLSRHQIRYVVRSRWWSGESKVSTFQIEELIGTKLRALYQRSKGRDLFDIWYVLDVLDVDDEKVIDCLNHYMGTAAPSYPQLAQNLSAKLERTAFANDLRQLVATAPGGYETAAAGDLVMERLGSRLRNAPPIDEIAGSRWRVPS